MAEDRLRRIEDRLDASEARHNASDARHDASETWQDATDIQLAIYAAAARFARWLGPIAVGIAGIIIGRLA